MAANRAGFPACRPAKARRSSNIRPVQRSPKMIKRLLAIFGDTAAAGGAYYLFHWVGFALVVFFVVSWYLIQLVETNLIMKNTLLSRLPDRCAICHREIVDEAGVFDEDGMYHAKCSDKLESLGH